MKRRRGRGVGAVAGIALLFAGATYEHRLRDLRRVRDSIARMR